MLLFHRDNINDGNITESLTVVGQVFLNIHDIRSQVLHDDLYFNFSRCDLTQGEFRGTRLRGLSFADSDIRGMRVGEVDSFELKGLKINALQAVDLVRLLGVEVEE